LKHHHASRSPHEREAKRPVTTTRAIKEFRELVWPRRKLLALGLVLVFINRAAGLVLPGSTKYLLDDVIGAGNAGLLGPLVAIVGAAVVVQAITSYVLTILLSTSAQKLIADMRIQIQEHVGRLPVRYFDQTSAGALVSRVMSDVEGVRNLIGTGLVQFVGGIVTALIAFSVLMIWNAQLTLLAVVFMAVFGVIMGRAFRTVRPIFRERGRINAEVTGRLTESFGGIRVVKGFNAEDREAAVFRTGAIGLYDNVRQSMTTMAAVGMASTLLMGIVSVTVMIVGGRQILSGAMTIGDFVSYTLFMGFMVAPVVQVMQIGTQLTEAIAGLDRVREVLAETPEDADPERTVAIGTLEGEVAFRHVWFEYEPGHPVLRDIDLVARPDTVTALCGSSGSGKSTLISLVAAFQKPTRGTVEVDGRNLSALRLDSYRSQLGVVLQDNFLFDGTLRENIRFSRPDADDAAIERAARIARVDEFALKMDKQYETVVGERGVKLSGGQRQRVAIARAVLADPRILILDEATSSLDTESEACIQEGLSALMGGRTTFVIAHRLSTIRNADQILVLEEGEIVERGDHSTLMGLGGRYFELYTRQADLESNRFINPGEKDSEETPSAPERSEVEPSATQLLRSRNRD
jgi:subfamily B ATP-binding cassette protein MsbA